MFALPCKRTLISMVNALPFRTGINDHIFTTLAKKVGQFDDCDRQCCLLFDEISIKEHLRYNRRFDHIEGFEDYGHLGRTSNVANRAMVFMVCGVVKKWKQPAAYYFSKGGMKSNLLIQLIPVVLRACQDAGLRVVATICDMGSSNVKTIRDMESTIANPFFTFQDSKIFTIFDPPYLLKCTRNMLLNHDVRCPVEMGDLSYTATASWQHIKSAYDVDAGCILRILYRLTSARICPDTRAKMRVTYAAQVLSHHVAATLTTHVSLGQLDLAALTTASMVKFCDSLFDTFQGQKSYAEDGKVLSSRLTSKSPHRAFWEKACVVIDSWVSVIPPSEPRMPPKERRMPSQDGWLFTINAIRMLWGVISKSVQVNQQTGVRKPIGYLVPQSLNQDPLENLFGSIRSHCGCNEHPTIGQFVDALKTCIINGLAFMDVLQGQNCLDDGASLLSDLCTFLFGGLRCDPVPEPDNAPTDKDVNNNGHVNAVADEFRPELNMSVFSTACQWFHCQNAPL